MVVVAAALHAYHCIYRRSWAAPDAQSVVVHVALVVLGALDDSIERALDDDWACADGLLHD